MYVVTQNKHWLITMNDVVHDLSKYGCHDSRNNLVYDSTTRYMPIIFNRVSCGSLGNEGN